MVGAFLCFRRNVIEPCTIPQLMQMLTLDANGTGGCYCSHLQFWNSINTISYSHCQHRILVIISLICILKQRAAVPQSYMNKTRTTNKKSQLVSVEFFIDIKFFRSHYGPGVDSASNRNEYQEHFLGGKKRAVLKTDKLSTILCRCHEIWEP